MVNKTNDFWENLIETNEDGTAKNVGLELLTPGRDLADKQEGKLVAVVIGNNVDAAVDAANAHGAESDSGGRRRRISELDSHRCLCDRTRYNW